VEILVLLDLSVLLEHQASPALLVCLALLDLLEQTVPPVRQALRGQLDFLVFLAVLVDKDCLVPPALKVQLVLPERPVLMAFLVLLEVLE